jgi:hypothetical protein
MSAHDIALLKMMVGTMLAGGGLILAAYGLGLIWHNWN